MSLLNAQQRAVVVIDTGINELIVDRCVEAFDALIDRGNVDEYRRLMGDAWAQQGYEPGRPIRKNDRPTALDKVKTICIRAYADRQRITFQASAERLKRMLAC